jgi:Uma2 family endonuclease
MNVAMRRTMTLAEFLYWEERQELRYEFDGVRPLDRNGGTASHSIIQANFLVALCRPLRGSPFVVFGSSLKFLTGVRTVRYPDAIVVRRGFDPRATVVENAVVVLEVLDESTSRVDRIVKAREYEATPSVQHYVMLEQEAAQAVVYTRSGESWTHDILVGASSLALPPLGVAIPLAELYDGVEFAADET